MNADKFKGFDLASGTGLELYRRQSAFIGGCLSVSIAICGILAFATLPLCLLLARALPRTHN